MDPEGFCGLLDPFDDALLPPWVLFPWLGLGFGRCSHLQFWVEQLPVLQKEKHTPAGASSPFPRPLLLGRGVRALPRVPSALPLFLFIAAFFSAAFAGAFPPPA